MALEDRVRELEEELKVLKNEIQTTLLDIQEQILSHYYPSLYPSANKEANLAQVTIAQQNAAAAINQPGAPTAPGSPTPGVPMSNAPAQAATPSAQTVLPAQAGVPAPMSAAPNGAVPVQFSQPNPGYHSKYKTQTITLVEEPEEDGDEEPEPEKKEESAPMRMAVVPKSTHKKDKAAANSPKPDSYLEDVLPQLPQAQELSAEDEAFLDAIVAKERHAEKSTAVSFDEFKNLVQKKTLDTNLEENLFTDKLLNDLLNDSFSEIEEAQLNVGVLFADPEPGGFESGDGASSINKQAVKTTVRKLLNWVDESINVIGKGPTKQAISMYVRAGDLSSEMREALMRLVDSSHVEPATEKAGIRQIIDTLGDLNDILDHHTPEYLNNVMGLITEVNFG